MKRPARTAAENRKYWLDTADRYKAHAMKPGNEDDRNYWLEMEAKARTHAETYT